MRHRLKLALAIAALQLCAALAPVAHAAARHGSKTAAPRPTLTQRRAVKSRRRAPDTLMPGMWGGEHIRFEVTESGANVEYDCAHETVTGKIVVDARGRFNVYGLHYVEHGGPIRRDETAAAGYRVRLSGRVGGSLMRLTVTRAGTRKTVGTFDLTRDREPFLVKCR